MSGHFRWACSHGPCPRQLGSGGFLAGDLAPQMFPFSVGGAAPALPPWPPFLGTARHDHHGTTDRTWLGPALLVSSEKTGKTSGLRYPLLPPAPVTLWAVPHAPAPAHPVPLLALTAALIPPWTTAGSRGFAARTLVLGVNPASPLSCGVRPGQGPPGSEFWPPLMRWAHDRGTIQF